MTFTKAQLDAIESTEDCTLVVAGPGAGKTTVLLERLIHLLHFQEPEGIVAITFTNAAADEIMKRLRHTFVENPPWENSTERLLSRLGRIGFIGTLHAYLIREMSMAGRRIAIINDEDEEKLLAEVIADLGYKGAKKAVAEAIAKGPTEVERLKLSGKPASWVAIEYWRKMRANNLMTYDAVLHFGLEFIRKGRTTLRPIFELLVDECQDSAPIDFTIYNELRKRAARTFFVGDPDQCQPAGTRVRMADGTTETQIEKLKPGDKVTGFDRRGKVLMKNNVVKDIKARRYQGPMLRVNCALLSTRCTPNHKWLVKWPSGEERRIDKWCTYIMQRGDWFRVGKTKFFRSSGDPKFQVHGLVTRLNQERGDKVWVLKLHDSNESACVYEQIVAAKYGLPEACFQAPACDSLGFSESAIKEIFASIPDKWAKAHKCLSDHGRMIEFPLIDRAAAKTRRTVEEVVACNLLDGVMLLPTPHPLEAHRPITTDNRYPKWSPISTIERTQFIGTVYSLDVTPTHKYVANGLVTCNSIYGFRGADVDNIVQLERHATVIKLEENFRSDIAICHAANQLIARNKDRIEKMTISAEMRPGLIEVAGYEMPRDEFAGMRVSIQQSAGNEWQKKMVGLDYKPSRAILVRTNREVQAWTEVLQVADIAVRTRKGFAAPDGYGLLKATLKFMANPENNYVAHAFLAARHNRFYASSALRKALTTHATLNQDVIKFPLEATANDVPRFLAQVGVRQPSVDYATTVLAAMEPRATITELAMRVSETEMAGTEDGPEDGVTITTIHRAKGREWDEVYLPGWCDKFFPKKEDEEERRLAFVALTRARHYACITYTTHREREYKGMEATGPSQFIHEALPQWKAEPPVEKTFTDDPMPA